MGWIQGPEAVGRWRREQSGPHALGGHRVAEQQLEVWRQQFWVLRVPEVAKWSGSKGQGTERLAVRVGVEITHDSGTQAGAR